MGLLRKFNSDIATGFSHIWAPFQLGIRQNPIKSITNRQRQTRSISLGLEKEKSLSIKALKAQCFLSSEHLAITL